MLPDPLKKYYFAFSIGAKYCYQRVCLSVRSHISKTTSKFH